MSTKTHADSAQKCRWTATTTSPFKAYADGSRGSRDVHGQGRILILDEDLDLAPYLRRLLRQSGFYVDVRTGVTFPVNADLFDDYQAVIMDVMMPQSNGFDGLRHVREVTDLPVLVLTARGDEEDRITGLQLGADDYVVKPCRPRELVARVRALLRRRAWY